MAGALTTLWVGDAYGRRKVIFAGAAVMTVGALLQCTSFGLPQFIVGRIVRLHAPRKLLLELIVFAPGYRLWERIHHRDRSSLAIRVRKGGGPRVPCHEFVPFFLTFSTS